VFSSCSCNTITRLDISWELLFFISQFRVTTHPLAFFSVVSVKNRGYTSASRAPAPSPSPMLAFAFLHSFVSGAESATRSKLAVLDWTEQGILMTGCFSLPLAPVGRHPLTHHDLACERQPRRHAVSGAFELSTAAVSLLLVSRSVGGSPQKH